MCKNNFIIDLVNASEPTPPKPEVKKTPVEKLDESDGLKEFIDHLKIQDEA